MNAIVWCSLCTCLALISVSGADQQSSSWRLRPTVQIALLIHPHNKLNVLPYCLSALSKQDYPSNRIKVYMYTEAYDSVLDNRWSSQSSLVHKNLLTLQALKLWKNQVQSAYGEIVLNVQYETFKPRIHSAQDQPQADYWNEWRFTKLIRLRQLAMEHAKQNWADFIWFLDADVILTNHSTLSQLIEHNEDKQVFAPMMNSIGTYSNFWAGMTPQGYYERIERYIPILQREMTGSHQVPMVNSCFLINLHCGPCLRLHFDPSQVSKAPFDDMITFGLSARSARIEMYVDNRHDYGFILPPMDKEDMAMTNRHLIELQLEHLYQTGQSLYTADILEAFVQRPLASALPGLDQVFVINLKRRSDRRQKMQMALNLLHIEAEIWTAIDGKQLSSDWLRRENITLMPNYRDPINDRPMTFGEVGCFLSHYHVWQHIVHHNLSQALILEDDVRFAPDFRQQLQALIDSVQNVTYDLLYLGRKRQSQDQIELTVNERTVRPAYSYWTIGYILTNGGARKLIQSKPLEKLLPVDEYLPIMYNQHPNGVWSKQFEHKNLFALSVKPLLIEPLFYIGDEHYVSDTEQSNQIKSTAIHVDL